MTPNYLHEIIVPCINNVNNNNHNLRNHRFFNIPFACTNCYQNSFFPNMMNKWNILDQNITNSQSISSFKNRLDKLTTFENDISITFTYCSPRFINISLCQLRHGVNDLNSDRFNDHLIESAQCNCGY